jgi:hypothetical protein
LSAKIQDGCSHGHDNRQGIAHASVEDWLIQKNGGVEFENKVTAVTV